ETAVARPMSQVGHRHRMSRAVLRRVDPIPVDEMGPRKCARSARAAEDRVVLEEGFIDISGRLPFRLQRRRATRDLLETDEQLQDRRLPRPVLAEQDRPPGRPAVAVGQVERLLLGEASYVLQLDREEVRPGRRARRAALPGPPDRYFLD